MLDRKLLLPQGILIVHPQAPLAAADFQRVAVEVDPWIKANGRWQGKAAGPMPAAPGDIDPPTWAR